MQQKFDVVMQINNTKLKIAHMSMVSLQASILHPTISINQHGLDWNLI